jgi:hypothetical protein
MDFFVHAGSIDNAFEMVCCFFTAIAAFASYLFALRF